MRKHTTNGGCPQESAGGGFTSSCTMEPKIPVTPHTTLRPTTNVTPMMTESNDSNPFSLDGSIILETTGANATDPAEEFPVPIFYLIAGIMILLLILLVTIFAIKFRQRIRFCSRNNNTVSSKNAKSTILPKSSYRQKNKRTPNDTYQLDQRTSLQNRDYASLTPYSKIETGSVPNTKSGPVYDQLEDDATTSKSTPSYFVLELENQTQTRKTNEENVLSDEYDKLLRTQSPDSQGRDRKGSGNHGDYNTTVVARADYDHIDRNLNPGVKHHVNANQYSTTTTTSDVVNNDGAYDHLNRSSDAGNKGLDVVNRAPYCDVQLLNSEAGNGGSPQKNETSEVENPYEKTIMK